MISEISMSRRLMETYMNDYIASKLADLENSFLNCEDVEDSWKLGFCYLVEGLLLADKPTSKVNLDFLSFIEDEDFFFFFQNPWGFDSYHKPMAKLIKIWYITKNKKLLVAGSKEEKRPRGLNTLYIDIFLYYNIRHTRR